MPSIDTVDLTHGIPLVIVVPALVELAKHNGLPTRLAGPAAIAVAAILLALGDIALGTPALTGQRVAGWLIGGVIYGLAAAGFYSLAPSRAGGTLPRSG